MNSSMVWQANWIWQGKEPSPRNQWCCFRRSFDLEQPIKEQWLLSLTADSRYVLFVNGVRLGRGPVRSWPTSLTYDEYNITSGLQAGRNTVAVLVTHYGIPTFQYLRGRGGLCAQLDAVDEQGRRFVLGTDEAWRVSVHHGLEPRTSRISCQLPFVEWRDARRWDENWVQPGMDDSGWAHAMVLGEAGMAPWGTLVKRDIPMLTEEPAHPVRVESLSRVHPRSWGTVLDLRNHFVPESEFHANNVVLSGYLATVIRTCSAMKATLGIVDAGRFSLSVSLNGVWQEQEAYYGPKPQLYLDLNLAPGDNLLLLDLQGVVHGHGFHIGLDCAEPFQLVSPWMLLRPEGTSSSPESPGPEETPFIGIGPFVSREIIDHRQEQASDPVQPDYIRARTIKSIEDLNGFLQWIKPLARQHNSPEDLFSLFVWHSEKQELPVPYLLHNLAIANSEPAAIPVWEGWDTELVIDFGKEYSGYIELDVEASAGTVLDFYGFEFIRDGWRQETYELDNTMRYICKEGRQTYTSLIRRGFRYLAIGVRNAARSPLLYRTRVQQSNYPIAEIGRFHCSDPMLNDIWEISRHTTRLCMEDTFVDCPAFEQAFWVGDARNEALVNYYLFGDREIVKRCLRLVPGSRFQSELYADQVPSGWNSVIPNWTFFWITACAEYVQYTGDNRFAEELWPHVRLTLEEYLKHLDSNGLLNMKGWNFLDWAPLDQPRDGVVAHQNMFLVKALNMGADLAELADGTAADRLRMKAAALKAAINAGLWSEEEQAYCDAIHTDGSRSNVFSMQTQVTALLADVPEGNRLARIEALVESPPEHFVQIGSPFMSFFHYEALIKLNRFDHVLSEMRHQYSLMIDQEATTCWETYPKPPEQRVHPLEFTRSHCHAWSAGPGYFLGRHVLGVRGGDTGWRKVIIEPQLGHLDWARGAVPLPSGGRIDVSWEADRKTKQLMLRVAAPSGLVLEVKPPAGYQVKTEEIRLG